MSSSNAAELFKLADRHVSEGRVHNERQRGMIEELALGGHDISIDKDPLSTLPESQGLHNAHRQYAVRRLREQD